MELRAAGEPVIGHATDDHQMDRNDLKNRDNQHVNAVLAAVGYNFSLLAQRPKRLLRAPVQFLFAICPDPEIA